MGVKRKQSTKLQNKPQPKKQVKNFNPTQKVIKKEQTPRQQKQEILKKLKIIWESLRRKSLKKPERQKLIDKLVNIKNIKEYILCSTASRVFQTAIKHSTPHQRLLLFDLLKDRILEMLTSKYGKHILLKFLKYGANPEKESIFRFMSGKFVKLTKHKEGSLIVDEFYSSVATKQQKLQILSEFYGNCYLLNRKSPNESFVDFIARVGDHEREIALKNVRDVVMAVIDRSSLQSPIVHKLIRDVMSSGETQLGSLLESVSERIVHLMHTADGSWVAVKCVREGKDEDHVAMLGQLKSFVWRAVVDDFGHLVVISLLTSVKKWEMLRDLIGEIMSNLEDMFEDKYAFRVLSFILSPNDDRLVPASVRAVYGQYVEDRCARIREECGLKMLQYVEGHLREMVSRKDRLWFLVLLLSRSGDAGGSVFEKLAEMALEGMELVEHPTGHVLLRHLIAAENFGEELMSRMSGEVLGKWIGCNRGCFVVVSLLGVDSLAERVVEMIRPFVGRIRKMECSGGQVLVKCIDRYSS